MPPAPPKPHGREAVRAALLSAATRLFADRGPRATSVRQVAAAAGVNHGLVHRHFGSKERLLQSVLDQLAGAVASRMGPERPDETLSDLLLAAFGATERGGMHWRILTRSILDGLDPRDLQDGFPVAERLLAAARRDNPTTLSPYALVTLFLTVGLGLLVFEPYLRAATGQTDKEWTATRMEIGRLAVLSVQPPKNR
jgi:AcrR family transcriptional regulator